MLIISHRGNLSGPNSSNENSLDSINHAINFGFDVEIDIRYHNNEFLLGHDSGKTTISLDYILNFKERLWIHAKDLLTFRHLLELDLYCFSHNVDDCALTSNGYMWTYPGQKLFDKSIAVLPELYNYNKEELKCCHGVCTDYPHLYSNYV